MNDVHNNGHKSLKKIEFCLIQVAFKNEKNLAGHSESQVLQRMRQENRKLDPTWATWQNCLKKKERKLKKRLGNVAQSRVPEHVLGTIGLSHSSINIHQTVNTLSSIYLKLFTTD